LDFTNQFYTIIPHDFGGEKPTLIRSLDIISRKVELLDMLADIAVTAEMMKGQKRSTDPIQENYKKLQNDMRVLERNSDEFKRLEQYLLKTSGHYKFKILDIFSLARHGEDTLFSKFDKLDTRKLLWHGSSVAVFAAILKTGLRIMPSAGGRVGAGLYFADMIEKSASYCGLTKDRKGIVLLNEVALGQIHRIQRDDSSLRKPPKGFDSVLAEGTQMPNPKGDYLDKKLSASGHPVIVPQMDKMNTGIPSSFLHNEYLVYDQTQVTMKYLFYLQWEQ